jgi:hypothetical protein
MYLSRNNEIQVRMALRNGALSLESICRPIGPKEPLMDPFHFELLHPNPLEVIITPASPQEKKAVKWGGGQSYESILG